MVTAGVLLVSTLLGGLLPLVRQPEPEARATLLLADPVLLTAGTEGESDGRAYVRSQVFVAQLPLVAVLTTEAADAEHPEADLDLRQVEEGLRVGLAAGESGLVFRMRHPDADVARYAAGAAAYSYQRVRRAGLRARAAATVSRLDAVERALRAEPPGTRRDDARELVARERATALVQRTQPQLGIVAEVPAELEERDVRRPVALGSGLLAGLVPALALGHGLQVRAARRADRGRGAPAPPLGRHAVGAQPDAVRLLGHLLPRGASGAPTVVAVLALARGGQTEQVTQALASGASAAGASVLVQEPVAGRRRQRQGKAGSADLVLLRVRHPRSRAALEVLPQASGAVVVTRDDATLWRIREELALLGLPVLMELRVRRRGLREGLPFMPSRRRVRQTLRRPLPVVPQ